MFLKVCAAILLNTIIIQGLKFGLDFERPIIALGNNFREIEGVSKAARHSFPSGHTGATFLAIGIFAYINKYRNFQYILVVIAFLVGYSRMYLAMHYMQDVAFGIFISMFVLILLKFAKEVTLKK